MPIQFLVLYNREAHLEWKAADTTERVQRAKFNRLLSQIVTGEEHIVKTVVDEVLPGKPGTSPVNEAYGGFPNLVTIIGMDGTIIYYSPWYRFEEVDEFLTEYGEEQGWLK